MIFRFSVLLLVCLLYPSMAWTQQKYFSAIFTDRESWGVGNDHRFNSAASLCVGFNNLLNNRNHGCELDQCPDTASYIRDTLGGHAGNSIVLDIKAICRSTTTTYLDYGKRFYAYCPEVHYDARGIDWGYSGRYLGNGVCWCGDDKYEYDPITSICSEKRSLILSLSGPTEAKPHNTNNWRELIMTAKVMKGSEPEAGKAVSFKIIPKVGGDGHAHTNLAAKPTGTLAGGSTNAAGELRSPYFPSEFSGIYTIEASCDGCSNTATLDVTVRVPDLIELTADAANPRTYTLVGDTPGHRKNHFFRPRARASLDKLFEIMQAEGWSNPGINDSSLAWGGRFDIGDGWGGSHKEHREGDEVDISFYRPGAISDALREKVYNQLKLGKQLETPQVLWHLKDNPVTGSKAHFHVYLLGQKSAPQSNTKGQAMMKNILTNALLATAFAISSHTFAQETFATGSAQDSFSRNPTTGEWTFNFYNPEDKTQYYTWNYTPRNQIKPSVRSSIHWNGQSFEYRYQVKNDRDAKQDIAYIVMRGWFQVEGNVKKISQYTDTQLKDMTSAQLGELGKQEAITERNLRNQAMSSAKGWHSDWDISGSDYSLYSWFPDWDDDKNLGIKPGVSQKGFGILRPELPGLTFTKMQGFVLTPQHLGGTPSEGPVAEAIRQMELEDTVRTHVMVPAIAVPVPWNGAELGRRIKAHIQSWVELQAMTPDMLTRVNSRLDTFIAAQEANDKRSSHQAAEDLLKEIFMSQKRMHHSHSMEDEEDDEHWQRPLPIVRTNGLSALFQRKGPQPDMERIAARALIFDVMYLLTRTHIGK